MNTTSITQDNRPQDWKSKLRRLGRVGIFQEEDLAITKTKHKGWVGAYVVFAGLAFAAWFLSMLSFVANYMAFAHGTAQAMFGWSLLAALAAWWAGMPGRLKNMIILALIGAMMIVLTSA